MHRPSTIWIPTIQMVARKPSSNNRLSLLVIPALNKGKKMGNDHNIQNHTMHNPYYIFPALLQPNSLYCHGPIVNHNLINHDDGGLPKHMAY
eukprot:14878654-Ditylum_brightwellii.AAC.1